MLTIEIPNQIRELVRITHTKEFPTSCWAADIVSNWLWDITQHANYDDPGICPMTHAVCEELGIDEGPNEFIMAGGELYRQGAEKLLMQALGQTPDKSAFLRVSAMVFGQDKLSNARRTIKLEWPDIAPEYRDDHLPLDGYLPLPVWQCLMRYYHEQWSEPIAVWHHAVLNWIRLHYEKISYPADQLIPFPTTA